LGKRQAARRIDDPAIILPLAGIGDADSEGRRGGHALRFAEGSCELARNEARAEEEIVEGEARDPRHLRLARGLALAARDRDRKLILAVKLFRRELQIELYLLHEAEIDRCRIGDIGTRADEHARAERKHVRKPPVESSAADEN